MSRRVSSGAESRSRAQGRYSLMKMLPGLQVVTLRVVPPQGHRPMVPLVLVLLLVLAPVSVGSRE